MKFWNWGPAWHNIEGVAFFFFQITPLYWTVCPPPTPPVKNCLFWPSETIQESQVSINFTLNKTFFVEDKKLYDAEYLLATKFKSYQNRINLALEINERFYLAEYTVTITASFSQQ